MKCVCVCVCFFLNCKDFGREMCAVYFILRSSASLGLTLLGEMHVVS